MEIVTTQVIGSMKDESCFSTLAFMKSKLRNRLNDHLDLVMHMFAQKFYTLGKNLYNDAILLWKAAKGQTWLLNFEGFSFKFQNEKFFQFNFCIGKFVLFRTFYNLCMHVGLENFMVDFISYMASCHFQPMWTWEVGCNVCIGTVGLDGGL